MPGGVVEIGKSLTQAAIRETKEKAGVDIEIIVNFMNFRYCEIIKRRQ